MAVNIHQHAVAHLDPKLAGKRSIYSGIALAHTREAKVWKHAPETGFSTHHSPALAAPLRSGALGRASYQYERDRCAARSLHATQQI